MKYLVLILICFNIQSIYANVEDRILFIKEPLPFSQEEQNNIDYKKALKLINRGNVNEGVVILENTLAVSPRFHPARYQLAIINYNNGLFFVAEDLLNMGLKLDKNNADFLTLLAKLHQHKDEHSTAMALLLKVPASKRHNNEYNALLALSSYKAGIFDLARERYMHLLRSDANNIKWWLGLAISQDALGEYKQAIDSFSRIKSLGRLPVDISRYIEIRLSDLKSAVNFTREKK